MTHTFHPRLLFLVLAALAAPGCGSDGSRARVDVPVAPVVRDEIEMAREVGRLLSSDARESEAAELRLIAQTGAGRETLMEFAETIPDERDPRWLHVLDEHHALPDLPPDQEVDFVLWKARRGGRFFVMKAESRLLDIALRDPDLMIQRLERGGPGSDLVAMALALADVERAIPTLIDRYAAQGDTTERRAAAEALARLAGEDRRPRVRVSEREIRIDADRLRRWYRHHLEIAAAIAAEEEGTDG